jgi:hypothetical protein
MGHGQLELLGFFFLASLQASQLAVVRTFVSVQVEPSFKSSLLLPSTYSLYVVVPQDSRR